MKTFLALLLSITAACSPKPAPQKPTPPGGADAKGTLTGTVKQVGGPACATPAPECADDNKVAANYEVTIYQPDGTTVADKTTTGADGTFSVDLPPGKYLILTPGGMPGQPEARTEVEVSRDALSKVELSLDNGPRADAVPAPPPAP